MIRYRASAGYSPRVGRGDRLIRQLFFDAHSAYIEGRDHRKQSATASGTATVRFESGEEIGGEVAREFDRLPAPFRVVPTVSIPAGDYRFTEASAWVKTSTGRRAFGGVTVGRGGFYGGDRRTYSANGSYKFSKYFSLAATVERNDFDLPLNNGRVATTLARMNVFGAASRDLFANALIQYSSATRNVQANIRVDWIHTPGSDLFVVFNIKRGFDSSVLSSPEPDTQAVVVKLTYLWAF